MATDEFDQFWQRYPRKVAKGAARKAWISALRKASGDQIITRLQSQIDAGVFDRAKDGARAKGMEEKQLIAHPATWLNAERWSDEFDVIATPETLAPKFKRIPDWLLTRMMESCGYNPSASMRDYIAQCGNNAQAGDAEPEPSSIFG